MSFREVAALDADVTIALGKVNKETGKPYPKQAEGYYLGSRTVQNKRGDSQLHFLQTANGNLGIWGTTDMNRKLGSTAPGTMVRITSTGTKPTPNGDMYTYKVEVDSDNTIDVSGLSETGKAIDEFETVGADQDDGYTNGVDEDAVQNAALLAAERKAKVEALLKGKKGKSA